MTPGDARRAIEAHTDLRPRSVRELIGGWANWTFEVDEHLIFRFPRTAEIAACCTTEIDLLPRIAAHLDTMVPVPRWIGTHQTWPFFGYQKIDGRPLTLTDIETAPALVGEIATALQQLHAIPEASHASTDDWLTEYRNLSIEAIRRIEPLAPDLTVKITAGFDDFLEGSFNFRPVRVHRDLGTVHVLVNDGRLAGLIDFESTAIGDPAIDFVGFWTTLGTDVTQQIIDRYEGSVDAELIDRVKTYSWIGSIHATLHGLDQHDQDIILDGLEGLRHRLPR